MNKTDNYIEKGINHILVYGSLRNGGSANYMMRDCVHIGQTEIDGYVMYPSENDTFPFIIPEPKNPTPVLCDVFKLPRDYDSIVTNIDEYEGYDQYHELASLFKRRIKSFVLAGERHMGFIYIGGVILDLYSQKHKLPVYRDWITRK